MSNIITLRFQSIVFLINCTVFAIGIGLLMAYGNYDWQGVLLVASAIGIVAYFLLPRMSWFDDYRSLSRILTAGLILKLGFSMLLLWIGLNVYGGQIDALRYHYWGTQIAQFIWRLEFDQVIPFLQWGTQFIEFFTGGIYSIIGSTLYGGYLIYACLAFLGSYFFYRAFRVAFPQGNRWLYAILVFFFPSILLWSNGIGKDGLIFPCIGLFAYGSAQLSRNWSQGFVPLALGLLGVTLIRPHIAVILALALILGFFVPGLTRGTGRPIISLIVLLVIGGFAWFLLPHLMTYLDIEELSPEGVFVFLQRQQYLTLEGGSAFQSVDISNPLNFPMATITVLFRPFVWEAHNLLAFVQGLEGLIFMGLVLWRIKSLCRAVVSSISNRYILFILIYIIAFIFAFSAVQNFGTLARWRTMMLPFFFTLLAADFARAKSLSPAIPPFQPRRQPRRASSGLEKDSY